MEALELVLFLLVAVVASSILEKLLPRLSLPLVQIGLGALAMAFAGPKGGITLSLIPHASAEAAAGARETVAECDALVILSGKFSC